MINLSYGRRLAVTSFLVIILSDKVLATPIIKPHPKQDIRNVTQETDINKLVTRRIEEIYNIRNNAFIDGNLKNISKYFDTSQKLGVWGLEHEIKRVKYLRSWADERGIEFQKVSSRVLINRIKVFGDTAKISLAESYKFDYTYPENENLSSTSFGVGIRHSVKMIKKSQNWIIYNDWYTDCFEDALSSFSGSVTTMQTQDENSQVPVNLMLQNVSYRPYNRNKAVEYADKYCGAAWGSKNNFKYNVKYMDHNGAGGDCTNFASQCLGDDKEGGGISQDYTWRCPIPKWGRASGSRAWVNADGLKDYLIYSGRGSLIMKGTFKDLTSPIASSQNGAIGKLRLGDLVCYEKKGNIDHFAIVTGFDSKGYPLINSHTTDRYHVPWDLGWGDKHIKFLFIHIN